MVTRPVIFGGVSADLLSLVRVRANDINTDFGIVIVWWFFYLVVTAFAVERLKAAGSTKSFLLFRRPNKKTAHTPVSTHKDAESGTTATAGAENASVHSNSDDDMKIEKTDTLFAWKGLNYTVPVRGGHRQLLNEIQGFTKPGVSPALGVRLADED